MWADSKHPLEHLISWDTYSILGWGFIVTVVCLLFFKSTLWGLAKATFRPVWPSFHFVWVSKGSCGRRHERAAKPQGTGRWGSPPHFSRILSCVPLARDFSRYSRNGEFARGLSIRRPPIQNTRISSVSSSNLVGISNKRQQNLLGWSLTGGSITLVCSNCLGSVLRSLFWRFICSFVLAYFLSSLLAFSILHSWQFRWITVKD